jgi:polysaccharide deacetylase family protein (PEP-CTERM system associated)
MITNALTVDVEEYYHAAIFRHGAGAVPPGGFENRVERNVDRLLGLMRDHHAKGTFFVLGEIAAKHPRVVRAIAAEGHEIASHGDRHEDVYRQSPREFRADIRRAKASIEDAVSEAVVGYRAPNFSIGRAQAWAYQILLEEGFSYDSSTHPIFHDRYGQVSAPRFAYEIWRDGAASLLEFPIGTARVCGVNLPIGGGGYFRLSPLPLVRLGINRVNVREERPVMFYVHPWEMDPDQPRPAMAWHHRFRLYVGVQKHAAKLDRLLTHFRFGTARQVLEMCVRPAAAVHAVSAAIPAAPPSVPA